MRHLMSHTAGLPGLGRADDARGPLRLGEVRRRCSPARRRGGSRARRSATTPSPRATSSARSSAGSRAARSARSSASEIAEPLGADFHIGTPPRCDDRVAARDPAAAASGRGHRPDSIAVRALDEPAASTRRSRGTIPWRRAEIPAAGGHGNARSVATVHRVLACGGSAGGVTLLSPAGCEQVFREQAYDVDLVLGAKLRHGIGYGLNSADTAASARTSGPASGAAGAARSSSIDLDARMCVAYVMNKMGEGTLGDLRGRALARRLAAYGRRRRRRR